MKKFTNWLSNYLSSQYDIHLTRIEQTTILGKTYEVIRGTTREKPDYDDAWLYALSREAEFIFDIGCNIGQSSLLMMHNNNVKNILLVDPNPTALSQAAQNLILNGLSSKAHFICAFATNKTDEKIEFFTIGSGAAGSAYASHAKTAAKMQSSSFVPTLTIDSLVEIHTFIPDLVKIDVEGAETLVLIGAQALAKHQKTRFFIEMHSSPISMYDNAIKIIDWCHNNNYKGWYLKDKFLLTSPYQISHRGRCHLLLLPKNIPFPQYLLPIQQGASLDEVIN